MKIYGQLDSAQLENKTSDPTTTLKGLVIYRSDTLEAKVHNGAAWRTLADTASTQTFTNKTLTSPSIGTPTFTGANTFTQVATPSTPASGFNVLYPKSDGKFYNLNSAGVETLIGSGSGGVNYISGNPDAESAATSWTTYADAAGSIPVDGTGGSPASTWTRTTSNPLRGVGSFLFTKSAANRQGEGVAYPFTIDRADRAKVLTIDFNYEIASGTYATGDLIVYVYDVTNSRLIAPTPTSIENVGSTGGQRWRGSFQSSVDSVSYRFIVHCASVSAVAYTVSFDNFSVGPNTIVQGTPVTDWVAYTPVMTWLTNATVTGMWRRVGSNIEVQYRVSTTGAPTATSLTLDLPTGLAWDTAKMISQNTIGTAVASDGGAIHLGAPYRQGASSVRIAGDDSLQDWNATTPITFGASDAVDVFVSGPIVGWSSQVQMSSDTDTRVCVFSGSNTAGPAINNAFSTLAFTAGVDTHGAFSGSTWTCRVPGYYDLAAGIGCTVNNASTQGVYLAYSLNGGADTIIGTEPGTGGSSVILLTASRLIPQYLNAGDTIVIRIYSDVSSTLSTTAGRNYFTMTRVTGPSQIAASETVAAIYQASTTSLVHNTITTVIQTAKLTDTHNAYSTSTGLFTAPMAGVYDYAFTFEGAASQIPASAAKRGSYAVAIKNGVAIKYGPGFYVFQNTVATTAEGHVAGAVYLNTGDTLGFQGFHNLGANGTVSTGTETTTSIVRRGL